MNKVPQQGEGNDYENRRDIALKHCENEIDWFEGRKDRARRGYRSAQGTVLFLSALTPLLVLGSDSDALPWFNISPLVQAMPAAIAAFVAGMNSLFDWQGNWIRYSLAEKGLEAEKLAFEAQATKPYGANLDDERERALGNFVSNINSILEREVSQWSARALRSQQPAPEENQGQGR